jgi:hypothetical protein
VERKYSGKTVEIKNGGSVEMKDGGNERWWRVWK